MSITNAILSCIVLISLCSAARFQYDRCMDEGQAECLKTCQQYPNKFSEYSPGSFLHFWDEWSVWLLGQKRIRGVFYTPCQERCIQRNHYDCSQQNFEEGDGKMYELGGRVPIARFTVIEEFGSAMFCFFTGLIVSTTLYRYTRLAFGHHKRESFMPYTSDEPHRYRCLTKKEEVAFASKEGPHFSHIIMIYLIVSCIACWSAVMFHIKDTILTEKMDYYFAFMGILLACYVTILRVFWLDNNTAKTVVGVPFFPLRGVASSLYELCSI